MNPDAKPCILVVDDDEGLREALAFDFRRKGYNVLAASGGHQALELVKTERIDLVLSDVRMPEGDGVELLDRVKEHNYEIPVLIFITGFADISAEQAYDAGADAVFSKPFQRKELFAAVARALLPRERRWLERPARVEAEMEIDLYFPEWNLCLQGHLINLGRGGMFVALKDRLPPQGATAHFHLRFRDQPEFHMAGSGLVRWVREQEAPGAPTGCGIEFLHLEDEARARILEAIQAARIKAYIPLH